MPSTTSQESIQRATGLEPSSAESRFVGTSAAPGIFEQVPEDIRRVLPDEVVDELLAGAKTEEQIVGPGGLLSQLTKRLVERAMEVERDFGTACYS
jgi:hypothetical protein